MQAFFCILLAFSDNCLRTTRITRLIRITRVTKTARFTSIATITRFTKVIRIAKINRFYKITRFTRIIRLSKFIKFTIYNYTHVRILLGVKLMIHFSYTWWFTNDMSTTHCGTNIVRIRVDLLNDILRFDYALRIFFFLFLSFYCELSAARPLFLALQS